MTRTSFDGARARSPHGRQSAQDPFRAARELLDFTLLGLLAEGPTHVRTLVNVVPRMTAPAMRPVGDVILRRLQHLFERGSVFIKGRDGNPATTVAQISPAGREQFSALMAQREGGRSHGTHDRFLILKTCVLDFVDEPIRLRVIDALIQDRHAQLAHLQESVGSDLPVHRFVKRCLSREIAELEREIQWLESLRKAEHDRAFSSRFTIAS